MIESKRLSYSERKPSDMALDGLFGGLVAGAAMAIYLTGWGLSEGLAPDAVLSMFDSNQQGVALSGGLTHLAVSSVYGILFGLIWWALRRLARLDIPAWLAGAAFGFALLLVAKAVVLPAAGSALAEIPTLHFAVGHLIYGATLGAVSTQIGLRGQ